MILYKWQNIFSFDGHKCLQFTIFQRPQSFIANHHLVITSYNNTYLASSYNYIGEGSLKYSHQVCACFYNDTTNILNQSSLVLRLLIIIRLKDLYFQFSVNNNRRKHLILEQISKQTQNPHGEKEIGHVIISDSASLIHYFRTLTMLPLII